MYFVHPQIKLNIKNFKTLFNCFLKQPDIKGLEKKLSFYFPDKKIIFTDMGRSAFQLIIEKLNLKDSSMLVPAYLCDIFYPIFKKYNISPVFLDADLKTFNLKVEEIEKKINQTVRSILVPHIYGSANDMEKINSLAKTYNLKVIEDCAHTLGARKDGTYLGNFGDAALFSFYKVLPTFRGGMLICPKDWEVEMPETFFNCRDFISFLNCFPFWAFLFKKMGGRLAPKMTRKEKTAGPGKLNRVSLNLFSYFFGDYQKNLSKRIELAVLFQKELRTLGFEVQESENNIFCYLSALIPKKLEGKRNSLVRKLREYKISCTRMWHTPLALSPIVQKEYNLNLDEFPNTKEIARRIINFPLQNFYTKKDIEKIVRTVRELIRFNPKVQP